MRMEDERKKLQAERLDLLGTRHRVENERDRERDDMREREEQHLAAVKQADLGRQAAEQALRHAKHAIKKLEHEKLAWQKGVQAQRDADGKRWIPSDYSDDEVEDERFAVEQTKQQSVSSDKSPTRPSSVASNNTSSSTVAIISANSGHRQTKAASPTGTNLTSEEQYALDREQWQHDRDRWKLERDGLLRRMKHAEGALLAATPPAPNARRLTDTGSAQRSRSSSAAGDAPPIQQLSVIVGDIVATPNQHQQLSVPGLAVDPSLTIGTDSAPPSPFITTTDVNGLTHVRPVPNTNTSAPPSGRNTPIQGGGHAAAIALSRSTSGSRDSEDQRKRLEADTAALVQTLASERASMDEQRRALADEMKRIDQQLKQQFARLNDERTKLAEEKRTMMTANAALDDRQRVLNQQMEMYEEKEKIAASRRETDASLETERRKMDEERHIAEMERITAQAKITEERMIMERQRLETIWLREEDTRWEARRNELQMALLHGIREHGATPGTAEEANVRDAIKAVTILQAQVVRLEAQRMTLEKGDTPLAITTVDDHTKQQGHAPSAAVNVDDNANSLQAARDEIALLRSQLTEIKERKNDPPPQSATTIDATTTAAAAAELERLRHELEVAYKALAQARATPPQSPSAAPSPGNGPFIRTKWNINEDGEVNVGIVPVTPPVPNNSSRRVPPPPTSSARATSTAPVSLSRTPSVTPVGPSGVLLTPSASSVAVGAAAAMAAAAAEMESMRNERSKLLQQLDQERARALNAEAQVNEAKALTAAAIAKANVTPPPAAAAPVTPSVVSIDIEQKAAELERKLAAINEEKKQISTDRQTTEDQQRQLRDEQSQWRTERLAMVEERDRKRNEAQREEAEYGARVLEHEKALVNMRNQMNEEKTKILNELKDKIDSLKDEEVKIRTSITNANAEAKEALAKAAQAQQQLQQSSAATTPSTSANTAMEVKAIPPSTPTPKPPSHPPSLSRPTSMVPTKVATPPSSSAIATDVKATPPLTPTSSRPPIPPSLSRAPSTVGTPVKVPSTPTTGIASAAALTTEIKQPAAKQATPSAPPTDTAPVIPVTASEPAKQPKAPSVPPSPTTPLPPTTKTTTPPTPTNSSDTAKQQGTAAPAVAPTSEVVATAAATAAAIAASHARHGSFIAPAGLSRCDQCEAAIAVWYCPDHKQNYCDENDCDREVHQPTKHSSHKRVRLPSLTGSSITPPSTVPVSNNTSSSDILTTLKGSGSQPGDAPISPMFTAAVEPTPPSSTTNSSASITAPVSVVATEGSSSSPDPAAAAAASPSLAIAVTSPPKVDDDDLAMSPGVPASSKTTTLPTDNGAAAAAVGSATASVPPKTAPELPAKDALKSPASPTKTTGPTKAAPPPPPPVTSPTPPPPSNSTKVSTPVTTVAPAAATSSSVSLDDEDLTMSPTLSSKTIAPVPTTAPTAAVVPAKVAAALVLDDDLEL
jgi:hypothetical protein